jgi:hypothetical protein
MKITKSLLVLLALCAAVVFGVFRLFEFVETENREYHKMVVSDPDYVGYRPIVGHPTLDLKIRQWKFVFSIDNNVGNTNSWRIAFFPIHQGQDAPYQLEEDHMRELEPGDEVEIQNLVESFTNSLAEVRNTYFVLSARKTAKK